MQQLADDHQSLTRSFTPVLARMPRQNRASAKKQTNSAPQTNEDAMGTEKLAEGIRLFARDQGWRNY
jgi:transaldolase